MDGAKIIVRILIGLFCIIFFFSGVGLIAVGSLAEKSIEETIPEHTKEITAEIVSIKSRYDGYNDEYGTDYDYDVYVQYEIDGTIYTEELNSYSSEYYEGKEIEILYNIDDPSQIISKDFEEITGIFSILKKVGIGLFVFCGVMFLISCFSSGKKKTNNMYEVNEINTYAADVYNSFKAEIREDKNNPITNSKSSDDGAIKYK